MNNYVSDLMFRITLDSQLTIQGVLLIYTGLTILTGCVSGLPFKERRAGNVQ